MTAEFGYAGKILQVDLDSGNITCLETNNFSDRFLGGRGIGAKIYWDRVSPDVGASDAKNPLIFATGPLAGFTGLAGSRLQICGKSQATTPEGFCYSNIGGRWGTELKFAGYDALIITGKSDQPIYLLINDNVVEIRNAGTVWGKDSVETREILKGELGASAKVLAVGAAGENSVSFATILAEDDASSSGGFAAVMGSKKLKAIVVKGSGKVEAANPQRLREVAQHIRELAKDRMITPPTLFPPPKKRHACYGCIAGCLRMIFEASNGEKGKFMCQASAFYKGPAREYYKQPTEVPFHATRLCDKYGLDTMVLGPMLIWLSRCSKAGILTDGNTNLPISKFGSLEFIESLVKKISLREGFGSILADGMIQAADSIGNGSSQLIGDLIFPKTGQTYIYDPRMYVTAGIFYATEPRQPIQHLHEIAMLMMHWAEWYRGAENDYVSTEVVRAIARRFWGSEAAADFSTYEGKALAAKKIQDRQYAKECLILCDYAWPIAHVKNLPDHIGDPTLESQILSAIIGKDIEEEEELYGIGERVFNLQRAILIREGRSGREADSLPDFTFTMPLQTQTNNPQCLLPAKGEKVITRKNEVLDRDKFENMKSEYYSLRGWDSATGLQTATKLKQLGLQDIAEDLARRELIVS